MEATADLVRRGCYICGEGVLAGQGTYYGGRLIHKRCYEVGAKSMKGLNALWGEDAKESLDWFRHKRRGVAYEILFIFITLSVSAIIYIVLDAVVSYFTTYIYAYYPTTFDTNYFNFIVQFWYWYPIICILFGLVIWGVVGAQQRNVNPYG